jgi:hypothetical protein
MSPFFARYLGIDYSGAQTPDDSLPGLRVFEAIGNARPVEIGPPPSPRKYWTRRGLAYWLIDYLAAGVPTLVGIDHGFSFPIRYFESHHIPPHWDAFLEDFHAHWPTDEAHMYVDFIRDGLYGKGALRSGLARWRRLTEVVAVAKSVFHFDVPGSVAKSTHAGLPWLRAIRTALPQLHFWPFDGWSIPVGRSAIAEVYPAQWQACHPTESYTRDQRDAYAIAAWLSQADHNNTLEIALHPALRRGEEAEARLEGWILGTPMPSAKIIPFPSPSGH